MLNTISHSQRTDVILSSALQVLKAHGCINFLVICNLVRRVLAAQTQLILFNPVALSAPLCAGIDNGNKGQDITCYVPLLTLQI